MKKTCLAALVVAVLVIGCTTLRSIKMTPDFVAVADGVPIESGEAVELNVFELIDGDNPKAIPRTMRIMSPAEQEWVRGNVTDGKFIEANGGWRSLSGPMYFVPTKIWDGGSIPKDLQAAAFKAARMSAPAAKPEKIIVPIAMPDEDLDEPVSTPAGKVAVIDVPAACVGWREAVAKATNLEKAKQLVLFCGEYP